MVLRRLIADILPLSARPLGARATPTADIYFLYGLEGHVGADDGRPVRRLGPNLFGCGRRFVLVRYALPEELRSLEMAHPERVYYIIDDDLSAVTADTALPGGYRRRLESFVNRILPRILALQPVVLAPNRRLLAAFAGCETALLEPAHGPLCDDFSHFDRMRPLRLVFAGTRSHAGDLADVAAGVARFLDEHPSARLTTFLGHSAPAPLARHRLVENRPALDWPQFKAVMAGERFHLALAPFAFTPANNARSANKVNDHAAFGAAGLYGRIPPYIDRITHGRDGMLIDHTPEAWHEALGGLAANPHRTRAIAEAGLALARRHGDPARLRRFWMERLGIG